MRELLLHINSEADQLEARADDLAAGQDVQTLLSLVWWLTEDELRDEGPGSCGHGTADPRTPQGYCLCCARYLELAALARRVRAVL